MPAAEQQRSDGESCGQWCELGCWEVLATDWIRGLAQTAAAAAVAAAAAAAVVAAAAAAAAQEDLDAQVAAARP